eukprot:c36038_g1_i1 orf=380-559(+)
MRTSKCSDNNFLSDDQRAYTAYFPAVAGAAGGKPFKALHFMVCCSVRTSELSERALVNF